MISRRGFLAAIAAGFAPAVVGSGVLMPVRKIVEPAAGIAIDWGMREDMTQIVLLSTEFVSAENLSVAKWRAQVKAIVESQWTPEQLEDLRALERPPIVLNRIRA